MDVGAPQQLKFPFMLERPDYDRGARGLSRWQIMARAFATRAIENGYLAHDPRTQTIVSYLWQMQYDDALVCGPWRLELVYIGSGMPHFRLYWRGRVFGVADIYADRGDIGSSRKTPLVRQMLAAYMVFWGWSVDCIEEKPGQARTCLDANTKHQYRLFKAKMDKKRERDYDIFSERELA